MAWLGTVILILALAGWLAWSRGWFPVILTAIRPVNLDKEIEKLTKQAERAEKDAEKAAQLIALRKRVKDAESKVNAAMKTGGKK